MHKASIAVALLAGVVIGVALGPMIGIPGGRGARSGAAAPSGSPVAGLPAPGAAPAASPPTPPAAPAPARQLEDPNAVYRVPLEDSPVRGPPGALVTVVVSSDLECPFCKRAAPTLQQIETAYAGKVRLAFKHNPLSMHRNAVPAAIVVEEARAQGGDAKFWALHDKLLALPSLDRGSLEKAAAEVGLSAKGVAAALDSSRYLDRLRRDQTLVNSLGATGTPTFFVNGRKVVGAQPFEAFRVVIDEELRKAEGLVGSGVQPRDVYARSIERGATAPVLVAAPAPSAGGVPDAAGRIEIRRDDPVRGNPGAPVTVVEFSDFQCPFCSRAVPAVKELEQAFGKDVRIAWKHLPLSFHANAMPAAMAAEAARQQGKFWEMHDRLFGSSAALSEATYERHAAELGLDLARFRAASRDPATRKRVEEDLAVAAAAGVTGTPTFLVNGEKVLGASGLRDAVDRQLQKARLAKR
jgi:protein-disulfide isomerase